MSVKIFGSTGIEFSDSNQEIKIKGPTQTFSLKATTDDEFTVYNAANKLWGMSSAGLESKPNVPYFFARVTSDYNPTAGSGHLLNLDNVIFNTGNHYNSSLKKFTAPVAGKYLLGFNIYWNTGSNGGYSGAYLRINGSYNVYHFTSPGSDISNMLVMPYYLDAGDYVEWFTYSSNASNLLRNHTYGFGYLIG